MFRFWDKSESLILPNGEAATKEQVFERYPFTRSVKVVLEQVGGVTVGIDSLPILILNYGLNESLSDEDMIKAITEAFENSRNPQKSDIEEAKAILAGEAK